jgi:L-amino acid N-acyltransferase
MIPPHEVPPETDAGGAGSAVPEAAQGSAGACAVSRGTDVNVRPARREDLPAILEIYNEAVLHTTATYDCEPRTLDERAAWFEDHARHGYAVFVAVTGGGRVVGWSALNQYRARKGYRFTTENSVYVAADHRGRGIGGRLLAPLIEAARQGGFHVILAGIDAANDASIRLHGAFGFREVARFKEVGFKFDRWLDVVYLELLL